ncbi:hypothetical protein C2I19_20115 [Chromobacterium alticapitis]|uniref:Uncharacterized protein n=1 Tax=Chromobacterium alticapitis TaxID=2073169 RepID=A0A2S5DAS2_9NEIS|nr:hypothetical protein C2I19_20115 [Chromobacterium alticapitis]
MGVGVCVAQAVVSADDLLNIKNAHWHIFFYFNGLIDLGDRWRKFFQFFSQKALTGVGSGRIVRLLS